METIEQAPSRIARLNERLGHALTRVSEVGGWALLYPAILAASTAATSVAFWPSLPQKLHAKFGMIVLVALLTALTYLLTTLLALWGRQRGRGFDFLESSTRIWRCLAFFASAPLL